MPAIPKDVPFLDTNMLRVLHRVFLGPDVPEPLAKPKEVLGLAAELVPRGNGWAWNRAVMEFGALRCTARRPGCGGCPLAKHCLSGPGILDLLSSMPRRPKRGENARYEDSNRYLRGRVLARLREETSREGTALPDLADRLREAGTHIGLPRLRGVVESPERDGPARTVGAERPVGEPAGTVSEERSPYAATPDNPDNVRVALP